MYSSQNSNKGLGTGTIPFSDYNSNMNLTFNKKEALLNKFAMGDPVYCNRRQIAQPERLLIRKPNEVRVRDAIEGARRRFEEQLLERVKREKMIEEQMKRYQDEHHQYYQEIEQYK